MASQSPRLERFLWSLALVMAASAAAVFTWKTVPSFRSGTTQFAQRVGALGASSPVGHFAEGEGDPPSSGPVPLQTHRGDAEGEDPWMSPGAHGPELSALAGVKPNAEARRWTWEDVNSVPIVRWDGDSRVVKPGAKGRQYAVRTLVDVNRARAYESAFGYEIDRAVIHYRTDDELLTKRNSLDAMLAKHGVVRQKTPDGDVLAPDYDWMINASLNDVRPIAQAVLTEARRRGAEGIRQEFGALASFVQQLEYGEAPSPGDNKHRFGLSMPLWALATNRGDCDTRAVLLVALARSVGLCDVELVRDAAHQHMLAAAAIPVKKGDHLVRPNGYALVLVETTDNWPVGRVSKRTNQETLQTLFLASGSNGRAGAVRPPAVQPAVVKRNRPASAR